LGGHPGWNPRGCRKEKKDRSDQEYFETAEDYLLAVVQGKTLPDAVRVQAAKTLISYQTPKKRVPVKSDSPSQIRVKSENSRDKTIKDDFEKRAAKVRAKFEKEG
jgi:hypothetical protein